MIGRVLQRGKRVYELLWYLYSPGKSCLHSNPHLVSGRRHPAELEPPVREDGKRNFRRLTRLLEQPLAGLGGDRAPWAEPPRVTLQRHVAAAAAGARSEAEVFAGPQLGKTPETLHAWHDKGYLPAVVSRGGQWCTFESFVVDVLVSPRPGEPGVIENIAAAWFAERGITTEAVA